MSTVSDVLRSRSVLQITPHIAVSEAAKLMRLRRVSAALVADDGRLVGVLTERDIVFRVVAAGLDIDQTKVGRVMTPNPMFVTPQTPILTAIRQMKELNLRHLPVVHEASEEGEQQVVGVISMRDFIGADVHALEKELGKNVSSVA